jgi:Fe-S-cluster-containing hydrogenase component 2
MLEVMRNILDACQKDPAYKAMTDELYKKRVLQLHLQKLSLFRDLEPEEYDEIQKSVELVTKESGEVLFDEHERSDSMYIIRNGLVKVVKKASALLAPNQVRGWKGLIDGLREAAAQPATPRGKLFQMLPASVQTLVRGIADGAEATLEQHEEIRCGINEVLKNKQFTEAKEIQAALAPPDVAARFLDFPANRKTFTDQQTRHYNRLILELLFPTEIRKYRKRVGPECILNYCAKGDFVGEIGVLTGQPRGGTCIAHGHRADSTSEPGQVELVRIPAEAFQALMQRVPAVRTRLENIIAERQKQTKSLAERDIWDEAEDVQVSEEFEQLGLIQGQRLMLIDLDRCTRCDECVRACVNTHNDGHSRLFLDGPRFGKYLVPTSCRSCLDPVCMIGCPVGSIHRGDNGQIVIEDWCIGCGLCAKQCPYGSIQMHDVGVVPEQARGWRIQYAVDTPDAGWNQPRFKDHKWALGTGPFYYNQEFRTYLTQALPSKHVDFVKASPMLYFRYDFMLDGQMLNGNSQFKLEVASMDPEIGVWVNGHELISEKPKRNTREYWVPRKEMPAGDNVAKPTARDVFRPGRNVIAVRVTPKAADDDTLLKLRLDEVRRPTAPVEGEAEITEKVVTDRAVVCDLCSAQFGQRPACVTACPHDAAMRVNARFEFPNR